MEKNEGQSFNGNKFSKERSATFCQGFDSCQTLFAKLKPFKVK